MSERKKAPGIMDRIDKYLSKLGRGAERKMKNATRRSNSGASNVKRKKAPKK